MTKSLFRQSFLFDSLDLSQEMQTGSIVTEAGVTVSVHERGVVEITPKYFDENNKNIIISTGIHGDETAPMEIVDQLIEDVLSGFQPITERILVINAHPEATNNHTRFIEQNLNRLFDDKEYPASKETTIANNLKRIVGEFFKDTLVESRWHLDLHCAIRLSKHYSFAVSPKVRFPVRSKALFDFVDHSHIEAVLLSNAPSSTFSWFSAENYEAQALTLELGQVAKIGENQLERLNAFDLTLRDLISNTLPEHLPKRSKKYRVSRTIVRIHEDFDFNFDDNVENFTEFMHGEVFGHDGDKPLMGKNEGEAIVFPNRHVAIGQRAALMVCEVRTRYENEQLTYD